MQRAWVEVDLDAVVHNATSIQRRSGKPLLPMVKADAYGMGAVEVCRALEPLDPWAFGIAALIGLGLGVLWIIAGLLNFHVLR